MKYISKKHIIILLFLLFLLPISLFLVQKRQEIRKEAQVASLPDLDVTYIERIPRYYRYNVEYPGGVPYVAPIPGDPDQDPNNDKHWPDPGEIVTFTVHFKNHGGVRSPDFNYKWFIDGVEVGSGFRSGLEVKAEATESYQWAWPADLSDHKVKFAIDPENSFAEISKVNNTLEDYTNALSYSIWVEQGQYDAFNKRQNGVGTFSFEDWLKWQFDELKNRLVNSKYPLNPEGIKERIRIDKIVVVPFDTNDLNNWRWVMLNDSELWTIDGRWQFVAEKNTFAEKQAQWDKYVLDYINRIDDGLLHELVHQLGIMDSYRFAKPNDPGNHNRIYVTDKNGIYADPPWIWECQGLMGGDAAIRPDCPDPTKVEDHAAFPLNLHLHFRRGFYGDYLFDIPQNNYLRILGKDGNPLIGVNVALYQKAKNTEVIDNIPEHQGTTDQNGLFYLENKPANSPTTVTSHVLRDNPFGQVSVVGENGAFLTKISNADSEEFGWISLRPFNLAYWNGQHDQATYTIQTNLGCMAGDANGDQQVNIQDVSYILSRYFQPSERCSDQCRDGLVNGLDLGWVFRRIYSGPDPATMPQTEITFGPALRNNPGDPPNFYCTTVRVSVQKCCQKFKIAVAYDNPNPSYGELPNCSYNLEELYKTNICQVLSSGQHIFYYHAKNEFCNEENLKSAEFIVP